MNRLHEIVEGLSKLADTTPSRGVGYAGEEKVQKITPLHVLEDNTDEFVALLQNLPENSEIKRSIAALHEAAAHVEKYLGKIAKELKDILEPGNDSKEIAKIKATSELNTLADQLEQYAKTFEDLQDLANTMKRLAIKHKEYEKHQPVKHKLRRTEDLKSPKLDVKDNDLAELIPPQAKKDDGEKPRRPKLKITDQGSNS